MSCYYDNSYFFKLIIFDLLYFLYCRLDWIRNFGFWEMYNSLFLYIYFDLF